jgi:hypothetical protein
MAFYRLLTTTLDECRNGFGRRLTFYCLGHIFSFSKPSRFRGYLLLLSFCNQCFKFTKQELIILLISALLSNGWNQKPTLTGVCPISCNVPTNSEILKASKRLNGVIKLRVCKMFQQIVLLSLILMSFNILIYINRRRLFSATGQDISKIYTAKRWGLANILKGLNPWR